MLFHNLVLGSLGTNCYILADESTKKAIVVDAPDRCDKILEFVEEKGYSVDKIVLTHGHYDHILALGELKEKTKAPLYVHENGRDFLSDGIKNLSHYVGYEWTPIQADVYLKDGDTVEFGGISLKVLHTPGHTADCICLLGDGIVISGDTLFRRSIGRCDHPTGDMRQEIEAIKEKLMILPDDVKVYPGHGPSTTIGEERKENPYLS